MKRLFTSRYATRPMLVLTLCFLPLSLNVLAEKGNGGNVVKTISFARSGQSANATSGQPQARLSRATEQKAKGPAEQPLSGLNPTEAPAERTSARKTVSSRGTLSGEASPNGRVSPLKPINATSSDSTGLVNSNSTKVLQAGPNPDLISQNAPKSTSVPNEDSSEATTDAPAADAAGFIPSPLVLILLLGMTLGALVFVRHKRKGDEGWEDVVDERKEIAESSADSKERRTFQRRVHPSRRSSDREANSSLTLVKGSTGGQASESESTTTRALPTSNTHVLFGAYRIEQEVSKLLSGQPHRMDVLSSRAPDDRMALETSLLKVVMSMSTSEDVRQLARAALEQYGFIARQSAALLMSHTAYERSSAAKMLGDVGADSSLPYLLEALYDNDDAVRIQAVKSIGQLKLPAAIGALLDMARRHPDLPTDLISKVLSACSVDSFDMGPVFSADLNSFSPSEGFGSMELFDLEMPPSIEVIDESDADPRFAACMSNLSAEEADIRAEAARSLGDFRNHESVRALSALAQSDDLAAVRSAAVTALGMIDHESVFTTVILAMAEDSREMKAAAARALSSLNFDRADAFARIALTGDIRDKQRVAIACTRSGIAAQAIDRLGSPDRRQVYEAFATLCVLAAAGETDMLVRAAGGNNSEVAVNAAKVLRAAAGASSIETIKELRDQENLLQNVREILSELISKLETGAIS